ncbi:MFS transporter [Actinoallomurus sp. CA-142502]|uniref:MFS transporter n=1 Tax=Actinoallomurus sp. CA-142502 TaxID=3239885 RepID=UPI003D937E24
MRYWLPLVACCLGTFLLLLFTTIVTVALPRIGAELHAGFGAQQWIIDVYTLALAGLLLGAGSLSDVLGGRRVHTVGLAVFGVATLACGLADTPLMLIVARAVQGVAGAAMFATILPLIALTYTGRARGTAFAVWGAVAGAASAVGTVGGGVLTEHLGWRSTFLAALPLCALALVLAVTSLPDMPATPGRIDWPGVVTISVAVTSLAYTVITGSGWSAPGTLLGLAVAVAAGTGFVLAERAGAHPILPPALFGTRAFAGVLLAAFAYYFAAFGALPDISTWLQSELRTSSSATSLVLTVQLVVFMGVSGLVSSRLHGLPQSWTLGGGTVAVGLGCLTGLALDAGSGWPALLPFLVLTGAGAGVVSPVLPAVATTAVPPSHAGTAGAAANSARQLGLALGVATCGTVFHSRPPTPGGAAAGVTGALAVCGILAVTCGALAAGLLHPRPDVVPTASRWPP